MGTRPAIVVLALCISYASAVDAEEEAPNVASVEIRVSAPVRIIDVDSSVRVNSNRKYRLDIPKEIRSVSSQLQFTQYAHDETSPVTVRAVSAGEIYLCLCNNTPATLRLKGSWEIVASTVGNFANPDDPGLEDFGEILLRSDTAQAYIRVDWYTPDALPNWGDGRLTILGTEGYIELRKYVDVAGRPGTET